MPSQAVFDSTHVWLTIGQQAVSAMDIQVPQAHSLPKALIFTYRYPNTPMQILSSIQQNHLPAMPAL